MEPSSSERNAAAIRPRRKAGLETPLVGRFAKENRRIVFAPPSWYDGLVAACIFGGGAIVLLSALDGSIFLEFIFGLVVFAGLWGVLSNERLVIDLTQRTYARWEAKRLTKGRLEEFDAMVLLAEEIALPTGRHVVYRLVLHWKGAAKPPLVVGRRDASLPVGAPLGTGSHKLKANGLAFAQAIGVRFYDNAYYPSPSPLPAT